LFFVCLWAASGFALNHWFGWKGLLAFPFVCLMILWIGKKLSGNLIKRFVFGLFSMKSGLPGHNDGFLRSLLDQA